VSEFAWFKLLVRLVGLLLIGLSLPSVLWQIGRILASTISASPTRTSSSMSYELWSGVPYLLGYGVQLGLGIYLLRGGEWVIRKILAEIHGRCSVCGFDIQNTKGSTCPECNTPFKPLDQSAKKTDEQSGS
jgi:hypothetical protein